MLGNKQAAVSIAVRDIARARKFYEGILGLKPTGSEGEEVVAYECGGTPIWVYRSEFAGTNKATAAGWTVGADIDRLARDLKEKGVKFEHYDMPGMKANGDVYEGGGMKIAWMKDPDGNILSLVSG
jgi:catechol 2,3-dioxygenase-like lactoylglutathione lyase family enzyme